jgi:hypothetical protein
MMTDLLFASHSRTVSKESINSIYILGTFNHWKARGTAVFLNNKIVMTPEMPNMAGLIYAKNVSDQ